MKGINEIVHTVMNKTVKGVQSDQDFNKTFEDCYGIVEQFEKEIREDQNKITRHACAENVSAEKPFVIFLNDSGISKNKAHQAIINTNAIKEGL